MFWLFDCEACGILPPGPGIKPITPALEGEALATGLLGKSPYCAINLILVLTLIFKHIFAIYPCVTWQSSITLLFVVHYSIKYTYKVYLPVFFMIDPQVASRTLGPLIQLNFFPIRSFKFFRVILNTLFAFIDCIIDIIL